MPTYYAAIRELKIGTPVTAALGERLRHFGLSTPLCF